MLHSSDPMARYKTKSDDIPDLSSGAGPRMFARHTQSNATAESPVAGIQAQHAKSKRVQKMDEVDLTQMTLFDTVKEDDIIKELQEMELSSMTPIDALNTLYRLQTSLKNRW